MLSICPIPLRQFLNCHLYYEKLRHHHRATISNNNSISKIEDIVNFYSDEKMMEVFEKHLIRQTDMSELFEEPLNLNIKFWNSGNNYFFNCMKYGFRKNVVPYKEANRYIRDIKTPELYSSEYYESLVPMSDEEIEKFLKENPIGIRDGLALHGIHRIAAMIGRLARGEKYISFYNGRGY